jgi:quinolinate synthase
LPIIGCMVSVFRSPPSTSSLQIPMHWSCTLILDRLGRITVVCLDPLVCPCSTMSRIDPQHLAWILEGLVDGEVRNQIVVQAETAEWAKVALERMLSIT